ncbi:hypothetical protein DFH06DRAFT_1317179 [Mycena polygramma]|nr:hypothetical protein DFH06DRAFT_1317179 [Mycena polygramma]
MAPPPKYDANGFHMGFGAIRLPFLRTARKPRDGSNGFCATCLLSQVFGVSATGLFMRSTMNPGDFNLVSIVERSEVAAIITLRILPRATAKLIAMYGISSFPPPGAPIYTALGGAAAFLAAYFDRPANIPFGQSRALLAAATALFGAVLHTAVWMVPVYTALGY